VHNEIDMHEVERHGVIGKGVAGVIYRVTWRGKVRFWVWLGDMLSRHRALVSVLTLGSVHSVPARC
jgi:predicted Ser/Thr protein kinase